MYQHRFVDNPTKLFMTAVASFASDSGNDYLSVAGSVGSTAIKVLSSIAGDPLHQFLDTITVNLAQSTAGKSKTSTNIEPTINAATAIVVSNPVAVVEAESKKREKEFAAAKAESELLREQVIQEIEDVKSEGQEIRIAKDGIFQKANIGDNPNIQTGTSKVKFMPNARQLPPQLGPNDNKALKEKMDELTAVTEQFRKALNLVTELGARNEGLGMGRPQKPLPRGTHVGTSVFRRAEGLPPIDPHK